jgi:hypothetical protein
VTAEDGGSDIAFGGACCGVTVRALIKSCYYRNIRLYVWRHDASLRAIDPGGVVAQYRADHCPNSPAAVRARSRRLSRGRRLSNRKIVLSFVQSEEGLLGANPMSRIDGSGRENRLSVNDSGVCNSSCLPMNAPRSRSFGIAPECEQGGCGPGVAKTGWVPPAKIENPATP